MSPTPPPRPAGEPDLTELPPRRKAASLATTLAAMLLAAADQLIVATALPRIAAELRGVELLAWTATAYMLGGAAMTPVCGRLSDVYGRKRVLLAGLALFVAAAALCGAARSPLQLALGRGAQGAAAAALQAMALATPADLYPPAERARYQALFPAVFLVSSLLGPVLGGAVTDLVGWRWAFYLHVPAGAAVAAAALVAMPPARVGPRPRVNYAGAALFLATSSALLVAVAAGRSARGWASAPAAGGLATAAVGLVAFALVERRAEEPLVPLALLRRRTVAAVYVAALSLNVAAAGLWVLLPAFLVNVLGSSAAAAGASFIPLAVASVVGSVVGAAVAQRTGRARGVMVAGAACVAAGVWLLSRLTPDATVAAVRAELAVAGLGFGLVVPLTNLAAQNAVPHRFVGAVTGFRQFAVMSGQAAGAALAGVFLTAAGAAGPSPAAPRDAIAAAVARGYAFMTAFPLLAAAALLLVRERATPKNPGAALAARSIAKEPG